MDQGHRKLDPTLWLDENERLKCSKCGMRMIASQEGDARRLECLRCGHVLLTSFPKTPLRLQITQVLRRARKLPIGSARNDLRQLARGLLRLHRAGVTANAEIIEKRSARPQYLH